MYEASRNPYARLWLVDALYERARRHGDAAALGMLERAAASDPHADVRRRAVDGLGAFRFLSEREVRGAWLSRVRAAARRAGKDRAPSVRAAGAELARALERWERAGARPAAASSVDEEKPETAPDSGEAGGETRERGSIRQVAGVLTWAFCFHLLIFAWQWMSVRLLEQSGPPGEAVLAAWKRCRRQPELLVFPALACALVLAILGGTTAYGMLFWAAPGEDGLGPGVLLGAGVLLYFAAAVACLLPAVMLSGLAARGAVDRRGVFGTFAALKSGLSRLPRSLALSAASMAGVWPWETLGRMWGRRFSGAGTWSWMARTGAPLAAAFSSALAARENLGWREAARRAARTFGRVHDDPAALLFGPTLFQPQFLLPALAAPTLAALSLVPPILIGGFSPARLFGWWFVTDGMCVVGFGLWAGMLLAASYLALLWSLGALYAAQRVAEMRE